MPVKEDRSSTVKPSKQDEEVIVVVEDTRAVLELVEHILRLYGYTVYAVERADACINLFNDLNGRVDLLLTDVVMPNMNGKELCDAIIGKYPSIRVLFMSGYADDVLSGILEGEVNFIQKPFTVQALTTKVREVLGTI